MMTEKYPTWLIGHVKEWAEKRLPTLRCFTYCCCPNIHVRLSITFCIR